MVLWLEIANGRIEKAAYQSFGCPAAIACASAAAEWAIGKRVEEAGALTPERVVELLESLPEGKEHCPQLAAAALKTALGGVAGC